MITNFRLARWIDREPKAKWKEKSIRSIGDLRTLSFRELQNNIALDHDQLHVFKPSPAIVGSNLKYIYIYMVYKASL